VPVTLTVLTERRIYAPQGAQGGLPGAQGMNTLIGDDNTMLLRGKGSIEVSAESIFLIETPAGGGFGHDE